MTLATLALAIIGINIVFIVTLAGIILIVGGYHAKF